MRWARRDIVKGEFLRLRRGLVAAAVAAVVIVAARAHRGGYPPLFVISSVLCVR